MGNTLCHPEPLSGASYSAVELLPDNSAAIVLDQRALPEREVYTAIEDSGQMVRAIAELWVRGAPAIGIAGAYGLVLAARQADCEEEFLSRAKALAQARPTAVNLTWAVERMLAVAGQIPFRDRELRVEVLATQARRIHEQDVAANRAMGRLGAELIPDGAVVLTHCNAGALATGGFGTALGVLRAAREAGKRIRVLADETRPWLQGSRLTAWELARDGFDVSVIPDCSAASFLGRGMVDVCVVGADRVAANGDVANKIGTYGLACLLRLHQRPLYVAAPLSTVDLSTPDGDSIPIEQRGSAEMTHLGERRLVPEGVGVENPAFDVTPAHLVTALITERGVVQPLDAEGLRGLADRSVRV